MLAGRGNSRRDETLNRLGSATISASSWDILACQSKLSKDPDENLFPPTHPTVHVEEHSPQPDF
jgi:hypothetical protein